MKNKFLLLGATALLSTGLVAKVMADLPALPDASATLQVQIGLYNAAGITVKQGIIHFGTLAANGEHNGAKVTLNPNGGTRTITGPNVVAADSGSVHKLAYLHVNVPDGYQATLSVPTGISLENNYGNELDFNPQTYLKQTWEDGTLTFDTYYIGGSIDLSDEFHGYYSGSFEVTAVYEEDPDYTPEP